MPAARIFCSPRKTDSGQFKGVMRCTGIKATNKFISRQMKIDNKNISDDFNVW